MRGGILILLPIYAVEAEFLRGRKALLRELKRHESIPATANGAIEKPVSGQVAFQRSR